MLNSGHSKRKNIRLGYYTIALAVIWTIISAASLFWNVSQRKQATIELATREARAHFYKDQAFRFWGTSHGGVYVPIDKRTSPNEHLKHVPERDITTPAGIKLTLMNPAYMLRQLMEDFEELYKVKGRITSLKPFRLQNMPDEWERSALESFEQGVKEVFEFASINGQPHIRLIRPMITKKGCLKCHAVQGYKEGDIRGGVGVSVPMAPYLVQDSREIAMLVPTYIMLWLLGLGGIFIGFRGLKRRIVERNRAEEALRESEEKYRLLIENQNDMLVKFDPKGRLQFVSQSYCDTFGKTQEELLGKKFMPLIHEDDRKAVAEAITGVFKPPYFAKVEERAMTKEGWRWQEWNNTAILNKNNEVEAVVAVGRNIDERKQAETALKKSEKQFQDLFNSISDIIYTQDFEGRFLSANQALRKAFGYEDEELVGHKVSDFMKPELMPLFESEYLEKLKTQGYHEGITVYFKKNGGKVYIEYRASMVNPDDGEPYISGTGRDVTDKIFSKRNISKLQGQLIQAQKMESIGTMAGGIAHDFNNILFPVFGYLEMMLMDISEDSPLRGQLEEVFNGAKRARDLVQQILTFSRQKDHELKPLKVHLVIKEALKLIKSSLPSTIKISQNIENDCGLVMADSTQFHQVIMNLCTNAFHAMEKTGGKLIVNLKESELAIEDLKDPAMIPGKYVCLTVADTGTGMEQSIIDRIFDPYFTTKEEGKGTGLGLAVAHGIVKSHGGHISVYSEPGKGSEFQILLPVIKKQKETAKVETDASIQKGDERILLVDDEDVIVQMIGQMLERLGYHVTARTSSTDALEAFRAKPDTIDLVITDLTMPNMTGDKLAGELIKIRPDIPVILCTGFSERMSEEKAKLLGIKEFLMKPVVMKDLSNMIRKVLDKEIVD